jgi:predicted anti-sigma-YlaC factor YlaD
MKCSKAKSLMSEYVDGALETTQSVKIEHHLVECGGCRSELASMRQTRSLLSLVGRKAAPEDLALRIRLAVSREAAQEKVTAFGRLRFRFENGFNAFMVPATAGLLSAIVFFGLLIGFFAVPRSTNDVQVGTTFYTPPELAISPFGLTDAVASDSVVLEAYVGADGRVQDYKVLSSPDGNDNDIDPRIKNMLLFTIFRPATSYGRPIAGKAVLSFSAINVKG